MAQIEMTGVSKHYVMGGETIKALDNLSLQIEKGEFVAIIGPSGSGKSTFMNIIGCLDVPSSGSYLQEGISVETLKENKLSEIRNEKIGFIFQNFNLLAKLTALENVELPLIYRGVPGKARREKARGALERVGLAERGHHLPNELSGGQQQRVAIARALVGNPPILLADEPTGALDSKTSKEIIQIMTELNEQGHTIILITHESEVARQAKRIIEIRDGQMLTDVEERK